MMDHKHKPIFMQVYDVGEEFEFHPKLRGWLVQYWKLRPEEKITVLEMGCDDNSCPIVETEISAYSNPNDENPEGSFRFLKLGKAKNQLTKQDVSFAVQKQYPNQ